MNEREDFLQHFRPVFIEKVERLETMTEAQVLDGLLEVKPRVAFGKRSSRSGSKS